jgi:hypothetical protein
VITRTQKLSKIVKEEANIENTRRRTYKNNVYVCFLKFFLLKFSFKLEILLFSFSLSVIFPLLKQINNKKEL